MKRLNDEKSFEEMREILWQEFLSLGEKYKENVKIPELGIHFIAFCTYMLFDCAPSIDSAKEAIKLGLEMGMTMHKDNKKPD